MQQQAGEHGYLKGGRPAASGEVAHWSVGRHLRHTVLAGHRREATAERTIGSRAVNGFLPIATAVGIRVVAGRVWKMGGQGSLSPNFEALILHAQEAQSSLR